MLTLLSLLVTLCTAASCAELSTHADRLGYITLLGRDTVGAESFVRSPSRVEGDLFVRIPATVHFHYVVDLASNGSPTHSVLETHPLGMRDLAESRVALDFVGDSVRVTMDEGGKRRTETRSAAGASLPYFMTGFGASYGLYESVGLYDVMLSRIPAATSDTVKAGAVHLATGRPIRRRFLRHSATLVDFDYFGMAWNHVTLDGSGRIASVDARETTEQTVTTRADNVDVMELAKQFANRDRKGASIGIASPTQTVRASLGGSPVVLIYSSPRLRGRKALGNVVPYDKVWRTGANSASILALDKDVEIGGKFVAAGTYSIWTLPARDGVQLIVNQQRGQWGTEYHPEQDLVRVPMTVSTVAAPREDFAMSLESSGRTGALKIEWDTFVWSVPVQAK